MLTPVIPKSIVRATSLKFSGLWELSSYFLILTVNSFVKTYIPLLSELLLIKVRTKLPSLNLPFTTGIGSCAFYFTSSVTTTVLECATSFETGEDKKPDFSFTECVVISKLDISLSSSTASKNSSLFS